MFYFIRAFFLAKLCKWVRIGCKTVQNIGIFQKCLLIKSISYRHLATPCIATNFDFN